MACCVFSWRTVATLVAVDALEFSMDWWFGGWRLVGGCYCRMWSIVASGVDECSGSF